MTRASRARVLGAIFVALALFGPGCSLALMERPSGPAAGAEPPACTETDGLPVWDTAFGTSSVVVGGLQLSVAHDTGSPALVRAIGIANAVVGGVHLASAVAGYRWARDCRTARDDYFRGDLRDDGRSAGRERPAGADGRSPAR